MFSTIVKYLQLSFGYLWLVAIAAYLAVSASQAVVRNYHAQQITAELEQKLEAANLEKQKLEALIVYYKTDAFKEKELRRALLLARTDEKVYALPESHNPKDLEQLAVATPVKEQAKDAGEKSNLQQWVEYVLR